MQSSMDSHFRFEKQASHNPWLDLLRSLAIFLVLVRHGSRTDNTGLTEGFVSNIFGNGWVGVDLFFVLSGYLIANVLIRRFGSTRSLFPAGYFRDRILRIVPAYYAVLCLCLVGFFPGFSVSSQQIWASTVSHLLFLQDYTGADINVVFWSLGVEEKFYILAPAMLICLLKCKSNIVLAALFLILLIISPLARGITFETAVHPWDYSAFFFQLRSPFYMSFEGFVIGAMVSILRVKGFAVARHHSLIGLCVCFVILTAWLGSHDFYAEFTRFDAWLQPIALAFLFGSMVMCAASLSEQGMPFEPFFRVNARLSYVLYLVHFPLIPLAAFLAHGQNFMIFWACYLILIYTLALVVHFGVEKPFLILKQRLKSINREFASPDHSGVLPS